MTLIDTFSFFFFDFLQPPRNNFEDTHRSRVDSNTAYRERPRSVGSGGPMRRPVEKRLQDKSPYSCGPYLSPPSAESDWRRSSSDSALHQSVQNPNNTLHSPGSQRRGKPQGFRFIRFLQRRIVSCSGWAPHPVRG